MVHELETAQHHSLQRSLQPATLQPLGITCTCPGRSPLRAPPRQRHLHAHTPSDTWRHSYIHQPPYSHRQCQPLRHSCTKGQIAVGVTSPSSAASSDLCSSCTHAWSRCGFSERILSIAANSCCLLTITWQQGSEGAEAACYTDRPIFCNCFHQVWIILCALVHPFALASDSFL